MQKALFHHHGEMVLQVQRSWILLLLEVPERVRKGEGRKEDEEI